MTVMGCWTYNYILESFHDAITRLFLKRVNCKQLCLHFWRFNSCVLFHDSNMSLFSKGGDCLVACVITEWLVT